MIRYDSWQVSAQVAMIAKTKLPGRTSSKHLQQYFLTFQRIPGVAVHIPL